jgi:hypothetical protein
MSQAPPRYTNVDGALVETDALRIAERVHEYDPNLSVKFLASAAQLVAEPPFVVVERCRDGVERPVFSVWKLDETVLQRLYAADNEKWNVLAQLDANNAKVKQREKRRYRDSMDEAKEIVKSVIKSPKSTYTVPESVTKGEKGSPSKLIKFKDTR